MLATTVPFVSKEGNCLSVIATESFGQAAH